MIFTKLFFPLSSQFLKIFIRSRKSLLNQAQTQFLNILLITFLNDIPKVLNISQAGSFSYIQLYGENESSIIKINILLNNNRWYVDGIFSLFPWYSPDCCIDGIRELVPAACGVMRRECNEFPLTTYRGPALRPPPPWLERQSPRAVCLATDKKHISVKISYLYAIYIYLFFYLLKKLVPREDNVVISCLQWRYTIYIKHEKTPRSVTLPVDHANTHCGGNQTCEHTS